MLTNSRPSIFIVANECRQTDSLHKVLNSIENMHLFCLETFSWTVSTTKLLLAEFRKLKEDFRNPKMKKKNLWGKILESFDKKGYRVTIDVLDSKFRNMKKTYKNIKDNNNRKNTGRGRMCWEYFNDFEEIFANDATINTSYIIQSMPQESPSTSLQNISFTSPIPISVQPDPILSLNTSLLIPSMSQPSTPQPSPHQAPTTPHIKSTPTSSQVEKKEKAVRNKRLYQHRKKIVELEEHRIEEIRQLRMAVEKNNEIQQERNEILKELIKQNQKK